MRQGTVFKILLVFRPRAGGEPRVNKHIWPSEESGLLDGRYIVYAGREGKNCSKNSFILTNRILQSTLWRTYSVQVKTQNAFVSYRITSPYFGLVFGDIWSEVGPLFPKTRNIRNASAFRKTRNSLMDVYSASVARLVSLAFAVYCTAHYNEKNLHTENFGQILRILGMAKWKSSKTSK